MHLLRVESRSIDGTAEAVDLGQTPADIIALSFTDTDLGSLAAAWEARKDVLPSLRLASLAALRHPYSVDLYFEKVLRKARFVLVRLLGCKTLLVTNAAGGINPDYDAGSLVAISDHINMTGRNPVIGPNEPRWARTPGTGLRFFDMTTAYSPKLRELAKAEATKQGLSLPEGVYISVLGPSYETAAEIRAFRTLGADLVGMSTVHEVIVARHMGLQVLGISLVTNPAAGVSSEVIHHEEVMEVGKQAEAQFTALVKALVPQIAAAI